MNHATDVLIDNLLRSLDPEAAVEHSFVNFHVRGMHYVNLLRTDRLTVKLYIFKNVEHNERGLIVWPHNHGYNFHHRSMVGEIRNHRFVVDGPKNDWQLNLFSTPLNGGDGLRKLTKVGLRETSVETLHPGVGYYLTVDEIHSISVHADYAAAILMQFDDIDPGTPTMLFAPAGKDVSCDGDDHYVKPEPGQIEGLVREFLERHEHARRRRVGNVV